MGPSTANQWQIPNCVDTICPHSAAAAAHLAGANLSAMPPSSLMQATGPMLPMPPMPPMFANGGGKFMCFPFSLRYCCCCCSSSYSCCCVVCCCCTKCTHVHNYRFVSNQFRKLPSEEIGKFTACLTILPLAFPKIILKMQSFRIR